MVAGTDNQSIGRLQGQKYHRQHLYYLLKMSINGASTILVFASWIIKQLCDNIELYLKFWLHIWEKIAATISLRPPENEHQRSVNDFWFCIMDTQRAVH